MRQRAHLVYKAQRMMRGGHGDEVVIKKCEILTSELSVVSWGI